MALSTDYYGVHRKLLASSHILCPLFVSTTEDHRFGYVQLLKVNLPELESRFALTQSRAAVHGL
jgi:hypothetical protein